MFVLIIEKRISCEVKGIGRRKTDEQDWYVLLAAAIPFKPSVGFELRLKGEDNIAKLIRVVYDPSNGTFWAQALPVLHPKPNAKKVAQNLVDVVGWDIAIEESTLEEASKVLQDKAIKDLQRMLRQAQTRIVMSGAPLGFNPHGPGRRKQ